MTKIWKAILTEAETRALIGDSEKSAAFVKDNNVKWQTASDWLADLLDQREKESGFQYNVEFLRWIEKREGWPAHEENGSILSLLIYNAQNYRRERARIKSGYRLLDADMIREAISKKRGVQIYSESVMGDTVLIGRPKMREDGSFVVFAPRSRTRGWFPANGDTWAKVAEAGT